jgi:hypothetical protein
MRQLTQQRTVKQNKINKFKKWFWRSTMLAGLGIFTASFYTSVSDYNSQAQKTSMASKKTKIEQQSLHHKTLFAGAIGASLACLAISVSEANRRKQAES